MQQIYITNIHFYLPYSLVALDIYCVFFYH